MMKKQYDKALEVADRLAQLDPQDAFIPARRSYLYYLNKDKEKSKSEMEAAIKLDPNNPTALYYRTLISLQEKDKSQAYIDVSRLVDAFPYDPEPLVLRGEVYLFDSDNERAIQDAEKALAFDPNNSDAYLVLVKAYLNQKEYDNAITKAKEAARLAPWSAEPYGYMGEAYMQKTLFDDAITSLKKAIALDPEDINARWLLYQAHLEIGDFDSVHTDLDDLLKYKDQLTSDQLDKAEADLVFVETIPPAVNGKRTVKDSTNNYTLTYSTDWRPEKTTSVDQALYLSHQDYPDDVKLTVFASRLGSGDPSNIPPYIFADAMKEAFKAMPGYQFIARKTFRAYGATGIADTFSYQETTDKGRMTMMTKIFFFVKGKDVIMIIYMTTPNLFDRYEPAVDEIAGTFRFLK